MINRILMELKKQQIQTYLINEVAQECLELYFIKKELEMRRLKDVKTYEVTIYHDFNEGETLMRGASSSFVYQTMTDDELAQTLQDLYVAAAYVPNPFYKIPSPHSNRSVVKRCVMSDTSLLECANQVVKALYVNDVHEEVFINSSEIYIQKKHHHTLNSEGVDVSYASYSVRGEFVVSCLVPEDVETYQSFEYDDVLAEALIEKVVQTLEMTKDRAMATGAPKAFKYTVLLDAKYIEKLLSYYVAQSSAYFVYSKYSEAKIGDSLQGDEISGDLLQIELCETIPYSHDGILMKDRLLLEDGCLKLIHGPSKYASYLEIEPTGNYKKMKVASGNVGVNDLRVGEYLEIVNFSDFQVDVMTGDFAGEVRLAYYDDGQTRIPVTGGSISGNIKEIQRDFKFSKERVLEYGYDGPKLMRLAAVNFVG